ncbi:MAG: phosphohydrolase [Candidatus Kuenenia stuttgartiensis]|nr:MAG: phosphohydrolase [Candidatus Kuenenia stuttgartiensis]
MRKVFRDTIHNLISFDNEEKLIIDLINTKEMQRLRRIKQLGLSYVTYSGTDHSRFSHSLGVAYLAKRVLSALSQYEEGSKTKDYIKELKENSLLIVTAALLHDLGHGPFSHALERITGKNHEKWTIEIICDKSTEVNKILKEHSAGFVERVQNIIRRTDISILVKVISSQLDVDRFDYLLRDSFFAGVEYGKFDLEWILRSLRVRKVKEFPEIVLDISKGKHAAEGYILSRYWMYTQVYYHKTTRGAEVLIDKILKRAKDIVDSISCDSIMKKLLNNETITVTEYLMLDDVTFLYHFKEWLNCNDKILSDLCNRLLNRKLFKSVDLTGKVGLKKFSTEVMIPLIEQAKDKGFEHKYYIESDVAINTAYKDYYLFPKRNENKESIDNKNTDEEATEQIFVLLKDGSIDEFSRQSEVINTLRNEKIILERLYFPEELKENIRKLLV